MCRRALAIGSETYGLKGVHRDVGLMAGALEKHGFDVETRVERDATRAGILDAYRGLIDRTESGDAVVLYYSGHGGFARNMEAGVDPTLPHTHQFLVPTDMPETTETDFRGILDLELSQLQAALTAKTRNVVFIADCCHASRMSRDLGMVPRALPKAWSRGVGGHIRALRAKDGDDLRDVESNPDAVRLAAAGIHQCAHEYDSAGHGRIGMFTEALIAALDQARDQQMTWTMVGRWIREQVLARISVQRPEIEGPVDRLLFETREARRSGALVFFYDPIPTDLSRPPSPAQTFVRGGKLAGVQVGNVYGLMPPGASAVDPQRLLGTATVTEVLGGVSRVKLDCSGWTPHGAMAFPQKEAVPPRPVRVERALVRGLLMDAGFAASPHLRFADETSDELPMGSVTLRGGLLGVENEIGVPVTTPVASPLRAVKLLENMARARALRGLESGRGPYALDQPFDLEWGRAVNGVKAPLAGEDAVIHQGDRIFAEVVNRGRKRLYVNIIDIGATYNIVVLNRSQLSGVPIEPGEAYCLGRRAYGGLRGCCIGWPQAAPADGVARPETLVVIVSDQPQDLTMVETGFAHRDFGLSSLQRLMGSVQSAAKRDIMLEEAETADVRFALRFVEFDLHPDPRPASKP